MSVLPRLAAGVVPDALSGTHIAAEQGKNANISKARLGLGLCANLANLPRKVTSYAIATILPNKRSSATRETSIGSEAADG
jgi:hypothetical protein